MRAVMKVAEYIEKLREIERVPTRYGWGTFGQMITEQLIRAKTSQYPSFWNAVHNAKFRALIGKAYSFDCIGLVKAPFWRWSKSGVLYDTYTVPDLSADQMIERCQNISTDMSNVPIGSFLWLPGHCGIYVGDGKVIESTPIWRDGVQITNLTERQWKRHGLLPWLDYTETPKNEVSPWAADAQRWVIESGISDGTRPKDAVTREQVWTMLYRMNNTGA